MKKLLFLLAFFFCLTVSVLYASPISAQTENELLPTGTTIESDYFRAANTIQINGDIKGDAFLAGGVVTVNGRIDGDLFITGGKVIVNGQVGNSVRIAGGDVTLNGQIGRNVLLMCGNCNVTKTAPILGSLMVVGGNLEVSAPVIGRGFRYFGSRLYLNSPINSEAFVVADKEFILGPQASISGNLKYTGSQTATREPGSTVAGKIAYEKVNKGEEFPRFFGAREAFSFLERIRPLTDFIGFGISAVIGFILLGLFPRGFEKGIRAIENRPYGALGWGVIVVVMIPVVAVLLALTIIGIPLSILLLIVGFVVYTAAKYLMAFFIGRKILLPKFGERRGWAMVLGLFLFYLLGLIPVVGNVIKVLLALFGLGAMIIAYKQPEILAEQKLIMPGVSNNARATRVKTQKRRSNRGLL